MATAVKEVEGDGKVTKAKQVLIVIGSKNDQDRVKESGMTKVFDQVGVSYSLSIISAHRNSEDLRTFCRSHSKNVVFIGIAGMSAALPGAIAANVGFKVPVLGVALRSEGYPDAHDAVLSMTRMPAGVPVAFCGSDKPGLDNAALIACQMLAMGDEKLMAKLSEFLANQQKQKPAQFNVLGSE